MRVPSLMHEGHEMKADGGTNKRSLYERLSRFSFRKGKLSTRNLDRLCRENATDKRTLVVHSEDVKYKPYFPNAFAVTKRPDKPADMHMDTYYRDLEKIDSESYDVILCTGLLEHVPDPQRLIDELRRILVPGGKLVISASAVFSFHEGPDNFFHFTPFSFRLLFKEWSHISMLRGASQPFETIAILMQRILMQSSMSPFARPVVELMTFVIPVFDRFLIKQYDNTWEQTPDHELDSMLPSNMQAVVVK
jgi:SAM-dependent methyltransferase